jgi:hypothetical protein
VQRFVEKMDGCLWLLSCAILCNHGPGLTMPHPFGARKTPSIQPKNVEMTYGHVCGD